VAFRREKYVPQGGPNGGDGGDGGSVVIRALDGVNSLVQFAHRKHWRADNGTPGLGSDKHGRNGADLIVDVPPGTVIIDVASGMTVRDLVSAGQQVVIARGGRGGKGNAHFKSSTNQAPREATKGADGEQRRVILELKVIADVGLVGMPNAGKSTLLSRLSRARPQIADYPFTTKFPNLGLVSAGMDHSFVMADIPGLIEGASGGAGLGHDFLRHIMRAGILVHLVEPAPTDGSNPTENYAIIRKELSDYSDDLASRPEIVVVSKAELPGASQVRDELQQQISREVLLISGVTGQGLNELIYRIADQLSARATG
jgi:GTP-binding protein